jgi:23S rRNA (cytosine1962-C5)-methyltransferase
MNTLTLVAPLSEKIKEGLPCLILDRLPHQENIPSEGWLKLVDGEAKFLSWGFVDKDNNHLHLLSDSEDDALSALKERFGQAHEKRRLMNLESSEVIRWVNSTGDNLSGFTIDGYGGTFVLSLTGPALRPLVDDIFEFLLECFKPERMVLKLREKGRELEEAVPEEILLGEIPAEKMAVTENGLKYLVQPTELLNSGIFNDLRSMRLALADVLNEESRVLNLFSYTAAFSLVAATKNVAQVVSVDTSSVVHAWAKDNFRLNDIDPNASNYAFEKADVFRYLEKLVKQKSKFDCIILDPPARARLGTARFFLKTDLPDLLAQCFAVLKPGGHLFVSDNTLQGSEKRLKTMIDKGAKKAKVSCGIVKCFEPEPDFPVNPLWPKGRGVIAIEVEII